VSEKYVVRRGETSDGDFDLVVTPESAGWGYSSLRVLELAPGGTAEFDTGPDEMVLLPLSGGATVSCDGEKFELTGRQLVVLPAAQARPGPGRRGRA
jgi:5-deoxy-glucuronate isomerase